MTLDLAKMRAETLALIQNHGGDLELRLRDSSPRFPHAYIKTRNGQTVADLRYSVTRNYNMGKLLVTAPTLAADTLRLLDEIERLNEALRFYADPEIYKPHPHGPAFERRDLSFVARAALAEGGKE